MADSKAEMGTLLRRKDIPPWVKVPDDLKDPEVLQVKTRLLEAIFGECAQFGPRCSLQS